MAVETELKLRIPPEQLARLKRHPFLRSLASERAVTRRLRSIYYDTPDLYLHKHAMALRLRRLGRQWVQTLKGGGAVQAGLHQRNEWETPVLDAAPDFAALEACGGMHLPKRRRQVLQAVFVTDFSRTTRVVDFSGAQIELSMDSGAVWAGKEMHPVSELELELKSGEPLQLFRLALKLLDMVPLEVETISKAEYGYRLWTHTQPGVARAIGPDLEKGGDVAAVLQKVIWSCLQRLQANVPGALSTLGDEYRHQMRVALRRLRVVLSMAASVHDDAELAALRYDVAALGSALGHTREWDVFVTQTLLPLRQHLSAQADIEPVLRSSERRRRKQHQLLRQIIQSQDFQRLLLRFGAWMLGEYWRESRWSELTAGQSRRFATQILHGRSRQLRKRYAEIPSPADPGSRTFPAHLHALRIACKKLRYSAEVFASPHADEKAGRYLAALGRMQDILGLLNDIAVARRLLDQLGTGGLHETVLIRDSVGNDYAQHVADLHKAWRKFSRCEEFWV